jgi:Sap, sulfolipid-1-addressing protein
VGDVYLLALTAALNPTLLTAVTFMLSRPGAKRLMVGYLAGAVVTSMTCGLLVVFALDGSSALTHSAQHTVNPIVDLVFGALILALVWVAATGRATRVSAHRQRTKAKKAGKPPPRWQQALGGGSARVGVLVGAMLTLPGASYLAALTHIAREHLSTPAIVFTLLVFNAIMLVLLEVPLLGFLIAPERTTAVIQRFRDWLRRRGGRVALTIGVLVGVALVARGAVSLLSG